MEIIAHGIDLVDFPRIDEMIKWHGQRFLNKVFTTDELTLMDESTEAIKKSIAAEEV